MFIPECVDLYGLALKYEQNQNTSLYAVSRGKLIFRGCTSISVTKRNTMIVENVLPNDYAELLAVWENSVRATHDFITEQDIAYFKPIILTQAFPVVTLKCVKNDLGAILGFIGVHQHKIEMLFVLNAARGKGIGTLLLNYAIDQLAATKVDVNEQNPQAVGFYQHRGFHINARSPIDDMGKPFPILHMTLQP